MLVAALAGLVAGALSMAAGEAVCVSAQADAEAADLALEKRELAASPATERAELIGIYIDRGLTPALAAQVADQLHRPRRARHSRARRTGHQSTQRARARFKRPGHRPPRLLSARLCRCCWPPSGRAGAADGGGHRQLTGRAGAPRRDCRASWRRAHAAPARFG